MAQQGLQCQGVFQDTPDFDDVEQLDLGTASPSQADPGGGGLSLALKALSGLFDLPWIEHFRQEGISGDIEEVLLFQREQLPVASGLKVEDVFLGRGALDWSRVHG